MSSKTTPSITHIGNYRLVLASASPRRREMMAGAEIGRASCRERV